MLSKKWVCYYRKADGKRSKSNLMVPKVSQPYKDAKTLLETVFRSRIGSIVSEEIASQVVTDLQNQESARTVVLGRSETKIETDGSKSYSTL